ncbi:MAG: hypothetical protein ACQEQG_06470 [Bacillota bacterium]
MSNIMGSEDGFSGCLVFLLIVFVVLAAGAGFIYFQWSNIQQLSSEQVQKVLTEVEENEDIESIEDIENIEDLEGIDLEELEEISPWVIRLVKIIPSGLLDNLKEITGNGDEAAPDEEETSAEEEEIAPKELLPASIEIHPAMTIVDYQDLDDIPEAVIEEVEVEEEFINQQSIFLEFAVDFPEREIAELRELDEVPDDVTDEMIEEEKDDLERLYNMKEVLSWYQGNLQENNWEVISEKEIEGYNYMFRHESDGYFIIIDLENALYTPGR